MQWWTALWTHKSKRVGNDDKESVVSNQQPLLPGKDPESPPGTPLLAKVAPQVDSVVHVEHVGHEVPDKEV